MANTNSNIIADIVSARPGHTPAGKLHGNVRVMQDNFQVAAADIDGAGDTIRLCRLQSNFRPISLLLANDNLDAGVDVLVNVGLYLVNFDGSFGAVKDENAFALAYPLYVANKLTELIDELNTSAQRQLIGDRVWEWAGDPRDRHETYDVVLTTRAVAPGAQAGTIAFQFFYSVD